MQEETNQAYLEDEISLREIIEALLKGKKIIAIVTIICIILSGFASFVVLTPQYKSTATILVNSAAENKQNLDGTNNLQEIINEYISMNILTYKEQVKSYEALRRTIEDLSLTDGKGNPMSIDAIGRKIEVQEVKDTNLIKVTVSDKDPEFAAKIANTLCNNVAEVISENTRKKGAESSKSIEEQLQIEQKNLNEKSNIVKKYLSENKSIDELNSQKDSLIKQLTSSKAGLNQVEKSIKEDQQTLTAIQNGNNGELFSTDTKNEIKLKVPSDGDPAEEIYIDMNDSNNLQASLVTAAVTKVQMRLVENISKKEALSSSIENLENKLKNTQTRLAEEEHEFNAVNRDLTLAQEAYDAYQDMYKEAILAAASDVGKTNLIVTSQAIPPTAPSSPNKKLNLAIGAVLGLMLGAFIVFFKYYWENSKDKI